ncbi:hypothetical protein AGMMS49938_11980 [Fibrobacterales bacterium]|nr:hypothetical protein AGMMS49938_11980 [Fibrobacterales bacterium]
MTVRLLEGFMNEKEKDDSGKVGLKTILKGNAAHAIRPAAISGFQVADFQRNPAAKETSEDSLKNEIAALQSQIATLNGEIANQKKKFEQEVKNARENGLAEGKVQGVQEGAEKALATCNAQIAELQGDTAQIFNDIAEQQKIMFAELRNATTEIALAVAKRVFCEEAVNNPQIIARVIEEAFTFLGQEEVIKVRLNPLDITNAEKTESFWRPIQNSLKSVELVPDEKIERGGCLLEAENGSSVDMRVQGVFSHIEERIKVLYAQCPSETAPLQT